MRGPEQGNSQECQQLNCLNKPELTKILTLRSVPFDTRAKAEELIPLVGRSYAKSFLIDKLHLEGLKAILSSGGENDVAKTERNTIVKEIRQIYSRGSVLEDLAENDIKAILRAQSERYSTYEGKQRTDLIGLIRRRRQVRIIKNNLSRDELEAILKGRNVPCKGMSGKDLLWRMQQHPPNKNNNNNNPIADQAPSICVDSFHEQPRTNEELPRPRDEGCTSLGERVTGHDRVAGFTDQNSKCSETLNRLDVVQNEVRKVRDQVEDLCTSVKDESGRNEGLKSIMEKLGRLIENSANSNPPESRPGQEQAPGVQRSDSRNTEKEGLQNRIHSLEREVLQQELKLKTNEELQEVKTALGTIAKLAAEQCDLDDLWFKSRHLRGKDLQLAVGIIRMNWLQQQN
jgi:hypothetical protein